MRQKLLFEIPECRKAVLDLGRIQETLVMKRLGAKDLHVYPADYIEITSTGEIWIFFPMSDGKVGAVFFRPNSREIKRLWNVVRVAKEADMI